MNVTRSINLFAGQSKPPKKSKVDINPIPYVKPPVTLDPKLLVTELKKHLDPIFMDAFLTITSQLPETVPQVKMEKNPTNGPGTLFKVRWVETGKGQEWELTVDFQKQLDLEDTYQLVSNIIHSAYDDPNKIVTWAQQERTFLIKGSSLEEFQEDFLRQLRKGDIQKSLTTDVERLLTWTEDHHDNISELAPNISVNGLNLTA